MKTADIRAAFLDFFEKNGHAREASASLIPAEDPSLLFTNAGMVPFKDYFLGSKKPPFSCATSSQRCLRVGGKHNDLENVGFTARHHTLFEMLGNFSFGAYDKEDAINYAWTFLTENLGLPKEKLMVTVYKDDQESFKIWHEKMQVPKEKIVFCDEADNFWSMGDTGPCGPCTEIFYDHGPEVAGGPPGSEEADGDRFVEIWNLVFMEFDRQADGTLAPLPHRCVDTGMGLERISAVMQGVCNNFDTDIFRNILAKAKTLSPDMPVFTQRIIADHMRAICWLIADQVRPSNEGRGYVLRRVIRRALRYAHSCKVTLPCLVSLVETVVKEYKHDARLKENEQAIMHVLRAEEEAFAKTLRHGMALYEETVASLTDKTIPGEIVFKLYDTFGFPQDLVLDLAREQGVTVDTAGYDQAMAAQKARSRQNQKFVDRISAIWHGGHASDFCGYTHSHTEAKVVALFSEQQEQELASLTAGDKGRLILDKTPCYAESGGQVGDTGEIQTASGVFVVEDTQKHQDAIVHYGYVQSGKIAVTEVAQVQVDAARENTKKNHSATHLLHAALREVLGDHVTQKGSLVTPEKLRFDYAHTQALTDEEWTQVEVLVNAAIMKNWQVSTDEMALEEAQKKNIMALFTEKYDKTVRVLTMGDFSQELCGGTHCVRTGDIGLFAITSETAVAQGVRRLEAVTGLAAVEKMQQDRQSLQQVAAVMQCQKNEVVNRYQETQNRLKQAEKINQDHQRQHMQALFAAKVKEQAVDTPSGVYAVLECEGLSQAGDLRVAMDACLSAMDTGVCVLLWVGDAQKTSVAIGVAARSVKQYSAKKLFSELPEWAKAKGGGKDSYAQGQMVGTGKPSSQEALAVWIEEKLKG